MKEILSTINGFLKRLAQFFNPIGRFYMQIQILCRVLVVMVFLDDLFGDNPLTCETSQIGCELNCENRFQPINHQQLWQFELFVILIATIIFLGFNSISEYFYRQSLKEKKRMEKLQNQASVASVAQYYPMNSGNNSNNTSLRMSFYQKMKFQEKTKEQEENKEFAKSAYTVKGYIIMLVARLSMEFWCIYLEYNLGKHHSQNSAPTEVFKLKEYWYCPTNNPAKFPTTQYEVDNAMQTYFPDQNRSDLFFRTDVNQACSQQQISVTCWIPFSRMKALGMRFMFFVLLFQTFLTLVELFYEIIKSCCRKVSKVRKSL